MADQVTAASVTEKEAEVKMLARKLATAAYEHATMHARLLLDSALNDLETAAEIVPAKALPVEPRDGKGK